VIEGRELAEVASTMNLSISTVRRRLGRVVKRIERVSGQSPATDWSASAASASADEASSAEDFDFSEMEMAAAG
jgi:hypothetical protein